MTRPHRSAPIGPSWPERRRYALARLLRMPTRHLATIESTGDGFRPTCVCGWEGDRLEQRGDALIAAHVHTRHVQPPPGFADEALPRQLTLQLGDGFDADDDGPVDATALQDARVTRRSW